MSIKTPHMQAGQEITNKIAETDIREQAARAGAQLMQSQAETLQATMNASSELAARLMEQSADQLRRIFSVWGKEAQKPIQSVSQNVQATAPVNPSLNELARDISREWLEFFRERTAKNLAGFNRLIACRNPQDLAAAQSAITRDNLISFLQCAQRVTTKSMQMANAAAKSAANAVERSDPS
ncbi:MAG: phasin family protein [Xanthobacteraceae bacterium]